ncbi:hypothetical protein RSAG8_08436, partial [Rhizoctonia solani AG-8 WAC10335]
MTQSTYRRPSTAKLSSDRYRLYIYTATPTWNMRLKLHAGIRSPGCPVDHLPVGCTTLFISTGFAALLFGI